MNETFAKLAIICFDVAIGSAAFVAAAAGGVVDGVLGAVLQSFDSHFLVPLSFAVTTLYRI